MIDQLQNKILTIFVLFLTAIFLTLTAHNLFGRERIRVPCKKLPEDVSLKQLENELEQERRGEAFFFSNFALTCRDAMPLLRKYALDPDPKIREIITYALGNAFYDYETSFYP